jgi:hypothetical protein
MIQPFLQAILNLSLLLVPPVAVMLWAVWDIL